MKCKGCGAEFEPNNSQQTYCSRECYYRSELQKKREENPVYERECPVCLTKFKTKHPNKVFCCADCASEYTDIAKRVMSNNRKTIQAMLERVRNEPDTPIKEIMKGYPQK